MCLQCACCKGSIDLYTDVTSIDRVFIETWYSDVMWHCAASLVTHWDSYHWRLSKAIGLTTQKRYFTFSTLHYSQPAYLTFPPALSHSCSNTNLLTITFARTALGACSLSVASPKMCNSLPPAVLLQLSWHFPPSLQDARLPASLFILLGISLLAPHIWHLLTLCAFINFIYLLTSSPYDVEFSKPTWPTQPSRLTLRYLDLPSLTRMQVYLTDKMHSAVVLDSNKGPALMTKKCHYFQMPSLVTKYSRCRQTCLHDPAQSIWPDWALNPGRCW